MGSTTLYCVVFVFVFKEIYCTGSEKFFRNDYVTIKNTCDFYKVHPVSRTWHEARDICEAEGAQLFYPNDEKEVEAVVRQYLNNKYGFNRILVGISTPYSKDVFETVDGKLLSDVYCNWMPAADGVYQIEDSDEDFLIINRYGYLENLTSNAKLPFLCKKLNSSLEWNSFCELPDIDYLYAPETGKCYKLHLTPKKWSDAYAVCKMEQSYLAVINTVNEANYLSRLLSKSNEVLDANYLHGTAHLGFKKTTYGWKTIYGVPINKSGYRSWGNEQPDGGEREQCGSMFYSGKLNDVDCNEKAFFICEHDIASQKYSIELRFGD